MANKTPFQKAADLGGKDKLLDKVVDMLERADESKEELKSRLKGAANSKLLHLLEVAQTIQERFGSKEKLVDALLALENRVKDADYRKKVLTFTPARLLDRYLAAERRKKRTAA